MSASKYHRLECVGEGTYGRVYKARCLTTGRLVAIKRLFPSQEDEGISATTLREIAILKEIEHQNIVELVDVLFAPPKLTLVFELCECDLKRFMQSHGPLEPELVMDFLHQLLCGVLHLHDRSILHRDLKPQNLLIEAKQSGGEGSGSTTSQNIHSPPGARKASGASSNSNSNAGSSNKEDPVLKICDFGLARAEGIPVKKYSHDAVTLWYRPPDVIMGSANYGFAIDIWSTGCIFAEMIAGVAIFQGKNEEEQLLKMFQVMGRPSKDQFPDIALYPDAKKYDAKPAFTDPIITPSWDSWLEKHSVEKKVGAVGVDLLKSMLQFDPKQRITATASLAHPYFEEINTRKSRRIAEAIHGLGSLATGTTASDTRGNSNHQNGDIIATSNIGVTTPETKGERPGFNRQPSEVSQQQQQ